MESKDELKEIDIKNFDDVIKDRDIYSVDILLDKNSYKTYENIQFMTCHTKLQRVENYCVLGSIK